MSTKYEVKYTRTAAADIQEIFSHIEADSRSLAESFVHDMLQQIGTLERFPARCAVIPERDSLPAAYRHLVFGSYRTIFRIVENTIYITRVIHGARLLDTSELESILQREDK